MGPGRGDKEGVRRWTNQCGDPWDGVSVLRSMGPRLRSFGGWEGLDCGYRPVVVVVAGATPPSPRRGG